MKYIFVTGGVVSGLGKGICAASLGRLLKQCGLRVKNQKFDPYLNVDPGTMSPYQHGEVFVTDDGAETDRLHPRQRRAQEQAHAAFRQGAALARYPAGYPRLPHGQPAARRCAP